MNYKEPIQSPEWHLKRNIILKRDNYRFTDCNIERSPFLRLSLKNRSLLFDAL